MNIMKKHILAFFALALSAVVAMAQDGSACMGWHNPTNFTMTGGSAFTQWSGWIGTKPNTASSPTIGVPWLSSATTVSAANLSSQTFSGGCTYGSQMQNSQTQTLSVDINGQADYLKRFVIKGPGFDPETAGGLSYLPPDTSYHTSVRLGNYCGETQAEALAFQFRVTPQNALFTLWFAMSLQNGQHSAAANPECAIFVERLVNGSWQRVGNDTLCRIQPTPISGASTTAPFFVGYKSGQTTYAGTTNNTATNSANVYLPWTQVVMNLYKYLNETMRIVFAAGDCAQVQHYSIAYLAGNCQPMLLNANGCAAGASDAVGTVDAPQGMLEYRWSRSTIPGGICAGEERNNAANWLRIQDGTGQNVDTCQLGVLLEHFIDREHDTNGCVSVKCEMRSEMNPGKPVWSTLYTDVCNTKPILYLDTIQSCRNMVTLIDKSQPIYTVVNDDNVDTNNTEWKWYENYAAVNSGLPAEVTHGARSSHVFNNSGDHWVTVRSRAYDSTCWNEKTVRLRSIIPASPVVTIDRDNICHGDTVLVTDRTQNTVYRQWHITNPNIDTTWEGSYMRAFQWPCDETTTFEVKTHNSIHYMQDTNFDGVLEPMYCDTMASVTVHVQQFAVLSVTGDTIVCNGEQSQVTVQADQQGCTFDWYSSAGSAPIQENNPTLITRPTSDVSYYVKATTSNGCVSWDTLSVSIVKPALYFSTPYDPKPEICTGDMVKLWGGKAASYTWTCDPPTDATFWGQEGNDTLYVSPTETTIYSVVGHGTNGCSATALSQQIVVHPYPIIGFKLTPDYIDSENPSVQFSDTSLYSAYSLWNFGNGETSTVRSVVHSFTDLSQDSLLIGLTSSNPLGCSRDTMFWIPINVFTVWFPNAFTPRLETNSTFGCHTANTLIDYELCIYDRNGLLVYHTVSPDDVWDGTYKGKLCNQGSYVYIARYRRLGQERLMSQKGTVLILN